MPTFRVVILQIITPDVVTAAEAITADSSSSNAIRVSKALTVGSASAVDCNGLHRHTHLMLNPALGMSKHRLLRRIDCADLA